MAFDHDDITVGDPRRCPRHGTVISSDDGMFDGLCGRCEMEIDGEGYDDPPAVAKTADNRLVSKRDELIERLDSMQNTDPAYQTLLREFISVLDAIILQASE